MTRLPLLAMLALAPLTVASAQRLPVADARTDSVPIVRASEPLVRPHRAGIAAAVVRTALPVPATQDSTRTVQHGRYAWWGLAIGVGAGWLVAREACRQDECYVTSVGLIVLGAGALGLLVGLLIG